MEGGDVEASKPPASPPPHYWEDGAFLGEEVPSSVREGARYSGLLRRGGGRPPLLLTAVKGRDHHGRPFHWLARRHRKRLEHKHRCPSPPPPVSWLGALAVRRHVRKPGWWIALLYSLGSVLFILAGAAGEVKHVEEPKTQPGGLSSLRARLVGWPSAVAANLCFFPGGLIQVAETSNPDYDSRLRAWDKGGRRGPRPRRRLLPSTPELMSLAWWGALIQLSGMLGFNLGTISNLVSTAHHLPASVDYWCVSFGYTYGGAGFTVSAVLFCWEATGSLWRGFLPTRLSDLHSISWHAAFWNFHGSVGFLIGGAALYAKHFSWHQQQWITGYGNFAGSVWFLLGALAALLEQANPRHP